MTAIYRLSARTVATAKTSGLSADGGGLYLQVTRGSDGRPRKSWVLRYAAYDGRRREMGLGSAVLVGLAEAREAALSARKQVAAGIDPIEARKAKRASAIASRVNVLTFENCAEAYLEGQSPTWKNPKHRSQWRSTLRTYAYPVLGKLPVQTVDVAAVLRAVEPIWASKQVTAKRVLGRIEAVLDWAGVRGYRKGDNPARWRGHLQKALPSIKKAKGHHSALSFSEIPCFMTALSNQECMSARALEFCIFTATRTCETIHARWGEIDLEKRVWIIPAARMKVPREHRVPLSTPVIHLLRNQLSSLTEVPAQNDFVFPGRRKGSPLSDMALLMAVKRIGRRDLTTHGFRSTFRDWAAEITGRTRAFRQ